VDSSLRWTLQASSNLPYIFLTRQDALVIIEI
jgi:hypothetical protein